MGLVVSLFIGSVVLLGAIKGFTTTSRLSFDQKMMERAQEQARILTDMIAFDLRMAGSGMPIGQTSFLPTDALLGDAPLPILTSATSTNLTYRLNENGQNATLTADWTPAAGSLTFSVNTAADLEAGDTIYVTNMPSGGTHGLKGVVASVTATTVTITSAYTASAGAVFKMGNLVERVTTVVLDSPADGSGITRNAELGAVKLAPNSSLTLSYLDAAGAALVLPLTAAVIQQNLTAIRVNVNVVSPKPLSSGQYYTASAQTTVALRNLIYNR